MKLRKPFNLASGEAVEELNFSWDALTFCDLQNAYKVKAMITGNKPDSAAVVSPQLDSDLRIGVAWIAALKSDSRLVLSDILKLGLADTLALSDIAIDEYILA